MTIALTPKLANEVRRYRHDWSAFLGADTIVNDVEADADADGVTIDSIELETGNQSVIITVSGGVNGTVAQITHPIVTAAGDEETEIFTLLISEEAVSLREAKYQCRMVEDDSQDEFIASLITPARAYVERYTRYSFVAGSRTETFTRWGDYLEIARRPITSIDEVLYVDEAGDEVEYTGFLSTLGRNTFPLRIYPGIDDEFPGLASGGVIIVTYTTGAVASTSEEFLIGKRAMLLLIGYWFDNRGMAPSNLSNEMDVSLKSMLSELAPISAY